MSGKRQISSHSSFFSANLSTGECPGAHGVLGNHATLPNVERFKKIPREPRPMTYELRLLPISAHFVARSAEYYIMTRYLNYNKISVWLVQLVGQ